jgi:hypothetical protein
MDLVYLSMHWPATDPITSGEIMSRGAQFEPIFTCPHVLQYVATDRSGVYPRF